MISLQTNVDSLDALRNLNTDNMARSKTVQQLSSGYRINSSGDDAAGLAVANGYRNTITQLTQGVSNGTDGIAQLQIVDGGLSNISTILNRMQTLATESASGTFTGSRATLNQEYQTLISEITRQASNINLNSGGSFNKMLNVFIGGANSVANAQVSVDLSGTSGAVDATSLGLSTTNILGGGVGISGNAQRIDATGAAFVLGTAGTDDQTFTFNVYANGASTTVTATVAASTNGSTLPSVLNSLNSQLNPYGVTASVDSNGLLQFSGSNAFTVKDNGTAGTANSLITGGSGTAENTSNYIVDGQATYAGAAQTLTFQTSQGSTTVSLLAADTLANAISKINTATAGLGVYAVKNAAGTGISLQGGNSFSVNASVAGVFSAAGNNTATAPSATGSTVTNATSAISAIATAIKNLGLVQGRVGTSENQLQYAIGLAQSQITNFSTAEGDIRDADVAARASDLTKSQVLEQTAVAALAQANSSPQAVLKLLQ